MKKRMTKKKAKASATPDNNVATSMSFSVQRPYAAGIDVGSREHVVCVGNDLKNDVRQFGTLTQDLILLMRWLKERGVKTVALESTGIYWQPLFDVLQQAEIEVFVVNGRDTKNPNGNKTDIKDSQHLFHLHSLGMTKNSYQPNDETNVLRGYNRHRQNLLNNMKQCQNRISKGLIRMNICVGQAIDNPFGPSGMKLLAAIFAGERDAEKLYHTMNIAKLKKHTKEEIIGALQGNWREDILFEINSHFEIMEHLQGQRDKLDQQIEAHLTQRVEVKKALELIENEGVMPTLPPEKILSKDRSGNPRPYKKHKMSDSPNSVKFDLQKHAYDLFGVDFFAIPSVGPEAVLMFMSEIGTNVDKFPTAGHFRSWLSLSPNHRISGGKILSRHTKRSSNRLSNCLRQSAVNIAKTKSSSPLKRFYHSVASRSSKGGAIVASAAKIATIMYMMLKNKTAYSPQSEEDYLKENRTRHLKSLQKRAMKLKLTKEEIELMQLQAA